MTMQYAPVVYPSASTQKIFLATCRLRSPRAAQNLKTFHKMAVGHCRALYDHTTSPSIERRIPIQLPLAQIPVMDTPGQLLFNGKQYLTANKRYLPDYLPVMLWSSAEFEVSAMHITLQMGNREPAQ